MGVVENCLYRGARKTIQFSLNSKSKDNAMKIRSLIALAGLAIVFTAPALGQKDTVDPQIIEQLNALSKKFDEGFDNGDAAALAALFTEDAVLVNDTGPVYGREAIEKQYADAFKQFHFSYHLGKRDQYSPHIIGTAGNEEWSNGEFSQNIQGQNFGPVEVKGFWSTICVREGDAWKVRMQTWNITPAPAK
jgi:ketosteroid isomerase-like protein